MTRLTPERLALLRATLDRSGVARPGAIPRRADPARAPLSFAQERLFFLELYQPGTALHNDCVAVRIGGPLETARLRAALAAVLERHEILRTTFALGGDGAEQRIHAPGKPPLRSVKVAGDEEARARAAEEARAPFELERAPPWRVLLARRGPQASWLVLTMHHLLSDGASMGLFFDDLARAYDHGPAALAPLAIQFGDYAAWERAAAHAEQDERDLAYWRAALGGERASSSWPGPRGRATQQGGFAHLAFEPRTSAHVAACARAANATSNHVLLAAWLALLAATARQSDVCTGIACSLRRRRELEPLIGFFVQSLALRASLAGDPTFAELVHRVRAAAFEAQEHAGVPFDRVARAVGAGPGSAPLLQTFFSHMRGAIRAPAFAGTRAEWEFVDAGAARFELSLVLHETGERLQGFLEYDRGLFAPETAARLAADYEGLLARALAEPDARLARLAEGCSARAGRGELLSFPPRARRSAGGGA